MVRRLLLVLFAAWMFMAQLRADDNAVREWTDSTGQFKIQASFVKVSAGKVQLRKPDGTVISVPLERLSEADRNLARELSKPTTSRLIKSRKPLGPRASSVNSLDDIVLPEPDESGLRLLSRDPGPPWKVALTSADPIEPIQVCPGPIPLASWPMPDVKQFTIDVPTIAYRPGSAEIVLARNMRIGDDERMVIERCDIVAGKSLGIVPLPQGVFGVDIPPASNQVVTWSRKRVDVWQWNENDLFHVAGCRHLRLPQAGADIHRAWHIDDSHLLVASLSSAVLWDMARSKPIVVFPDHNLWSVSPSRRFAVAQGSNHTLAIFEAKTGRMLGERPLPISYWPFLSFSADEKRIVGVDEQEMFVFEVTTGEVLHEFETNAGFSENRGAQQIVWPTPDHVLVDGGQLVDLKRGVVLWSYKEGSIFGTLAAGQYWFVPEESGSNPVLAHAAIPHSDVLTYGENLTPQNVLEPGSKIALQIEGELTEEERGGYKNFAQSLIRETGFEIADESPLVLLVTVRPAKEVPKIYTAMFDVVYSLRDNGKEVWRYPSGIAYSKDDGRTKLPTIPELIDRHERAFVRLPRRLTRSNGLGVSKLTPTGVQ